MNEFFATEFETHILRSRILCAKIGLIVASGLFAAGIADGAKDVQPAPAPEAPALGLRDQNVQTIIEVEGTVIEVAAASRREFLRNLRAPEERDRSALDLLDAALTRGKSATVLTPEQTDAILRFIDRQKGIAQMRLQRGGTKPGLRTKIEGTRQFRYPTTWDTRSKPFTPGNFKIKDCGFSLDVTPHLTGATVVSLTATAKLVEFLGVVDTESGATFPRKDTGKRIQWLRDADFGYPDVSNRALRHVFSTRENEARADLASGSTLLLTGLRETEDVSDFKSIAPTGPLIVLVTVNVAKEIVAPTVLPAPAAGEITSTRLDGPAIDATPAQDARPPSAPPDEGLPRASPVPGKPGYVTSPYAPGRKPIDVRGFPPGTEVRCPYSGITFLVP